jgi:hypothetical protein
MLDETADGRRLFAAPHKFTLNEILVAWREEASPGETSSPTLSSRSNPTSKSVVANVEPLL